MEHQFKCFLVSMRSEDDTVDFEADSINEALKIATQKVGVRTWHLRFQIARTGSDVMDGQIATYRARPWHLYIHEYQGE